MARARDSREEIVLAVFSSSSKASDEAFVGKGSYVGVVLDFGSISFDTPKLDFVSANPNFERVSTVTSFVFDPLRNEFAILDGKRHAAANQIANLTFTPQEYMKMVTLLFGLGKV